MCGASGECPSLIPSHHTNLGNSRRGAVCEENATPAPKVLMPLPPTLTGRRTCPSLSASTAVTPTPTPPPPTPRLCPPPPLTPSDTLSLITLVQARVRQRTSPREQKRTEQHFPGHGIAGPCAGACRGSVSPRPILPTLKLARLWLGRRRFQVFWGCAAGGDRPLGRHLATLVFVLKGTTRGLPDMWLGFGP